MRSRPFHAKMFNDPYVQGLSLAERWLYTYYLFNERVNWIGCYEVTDRMVLFEAGEGISPETLKKAKERFSKDGKIIFAEGYTILRNSEKYETHMNNIQLMGSALKQFKELPDNVKDMFLRVKPLEVIEAYRASFERLLYKLQVSYSVGYNVGYTVDEGQGQEISISIKGEYEGEIEAMKELWKSILGTPLRNHQEANLKDYRYLTKELGDRLPEYLQAVRMIRADRFAKRTLQEKLFNYCGLREKLEQVESYMQGRVDAKASGINQNKRNVAII